MAQLANTRGGSISSGRGCVKTGLAHFFSVRGAIFDCSDWGAIADFDLYAAQQLGHNTARHGPAVKLVTVAKLVRATLRWKTRRPVTEDPFCKQGVLIVKTSLAFVAVAAALLAVVSNATPAFAQAAATSAAVIDIPYIFKNHVRFQQAIDDIKKDIDGYKEFVQQEEQKIRAEAEKASQFKPGTREYKTIEENVARMKVELQLEGAKRQKDFMEREAQAYFNAYQEVEAAVADFAVRNRVNLVLRYSGETMDPTKRESIMQGINRFVVYQDRLNITDLVLDMVNRGGSAPQQPGAGSPQPPGLSSRPQPPRAPAASPVIPRR
jgi:Skp family chaperone for outer membrane proteins